MNDAAPHLYPLPIGPGGMRPIGCELAPIATHFFAKALEIYGVSREDIIGHCRKKHIMQARHFVIYHIAVHSSSSLERMSRLLGGRDHTTILNSIAKYARPRGLSTGRYYTRGIPAGRFGKAVALAAKWKDEVLEKRAEGKYIKDIADEIGNPAVTQAVVAYIIRQHAPAHLKQLPSRRNLRLQENIAKVIALKRKGLTHREVADRLGFRPAYVSFVVQEHVPIKERKSWPPSQGKPLAQQFRSRVLKLDREGLGPSAIMKRIDDPMLSRGVVQYIRREFRMAEFAEAAE